MNFQPLLLRVRPAALDRCQIENPFHLCLNGWWAQILIRTQSCFGRILGIQGHFHPSIIHHHGSMLCVGWSPKCCKPNWGFSSLSLDLSSMFLRSCSSILGIAMSMRYLDVPKLACLISFDTPDWQYFHHWDWILRTKLFGVSFHSLNNFGSAPTKVGEVCSWPDSKWWSHPNLEQYHPIQSLFQDPHHFESNI